MKREKLVDLMPFLFYTYALFEVLRNSMFSEYYPIDMLRNFLMGFIILYSALIIVPKRFPKKQFIVIVIVLISILISSLVSRTIILLLNFFVILSLIGEDEYKINKICKATMLGLVIGCGIVLISVFIGIIPDKVVFEYQRLRHSLGFSIPPNLPNFYTAICVIYIYLTRFKGYIIRYVSLLIPAMIIMDYTDGRGSFFTLLLVVLIVISFNILKKFRVDLTSFLSKVCIFSYVSIFSLSILIGIIYTRSNVLQQFNVLFTGRLEWFSVAWNTYSINLFGHSFGESSRLIMLDNLYLILLLRNGLIVFLIISIVVFNLLFFMKNRRDGVAVAILLAIIVHSAVSASWLPIWKNVILFQIALMLSEKKGSPIAKKMIFEDPWKNQ